MLASLGCIAHLDPDVAIFDDGSSDPIELQLKDVPLPRLPRITRDSTSPGYICGRNRLVRESSAPFVLLLDDDTRLMTPTSIEAALHVLQMDGTVAAIAFAQAEADGRPWPAAMQPSHATMPAVVPSYIGFAHLLRRDVFMRLSGYRESFKFYGEEKDYCLRLIDAGYRTVYLPDALIAHLSDRASRNPQRYLRFVARNDCLNTLYNDPFVRVIWMFPARFAIYFRMRHAWNIDDPWGWVWLARELISSMPDVFAHRRPVSRRTIERWQQLHRTHVPYQLPEAIREGRGFVEESHRFAAAGLTRGA